MIFWLSSEDQNSPRADPFQVWQMQLPLPEKWGMFWCAWCDGCRTWFSPQTSNESTSTLADEYIGWIMIFWCSFPSQKSGEWSDALDAIAVGCDLAPRCSIRVHQSWQMNTLDESWYFDHPQWTRTHLGLTLSRFDKCSSYSLLQRSDWIGCNFPLCMTPGSNRMVMEAVRWPQAKQGVILALLNHQGSTFSSKIQVQDLVPCPTIEKVRVKKLEERKVRIRKFSET